jgi:hypothetical protein
VATCNGRSHFTPRRSPQNCRRGKHRSRICRFLIDPYLMSGYDARPVSPSHLAPVELTLNHL